MLTQKKNDLQPVTNACPACRDGVTTQRELSERGYKRVYLKGCAMHVAMFDAADARERAKEERRAEVGA